MTGTKLQKMPTKPEILLYQTEDGRTKLEVRFEGETVWLNQKQLAELFQKDVRTINEHIRNIFEEGELTPESVIRNFRITASDGKYYDIQHFNLDVIIAVGYRVKSHRGTQFRIWATERLREFIVKGFTLDDERLKRNGGGNYTFTGTVDGDNIDGTFTETDEADGGFAGFNSTTNTVVVYCGTWTRPADPAHDCNNDRSGVWNIASSNGVITGVENRDDGTHVNTLSGTVSGNDITITNDGEGGTGTGTISGDTVSGQFTNHKGCQGTWEGTAGCQ